MTYTKVHEAWENLPSTNTPITAEALDQIEEGIETADEAAAAAQATADGHIADASAAHAASAVSFSPTGTVASTDVQAAIAEVSGDVATEASARSSGDSANSSALTSHLNDSSGAHAASAIGFTPTGSIAASDVQAAIAEVAAEAGTGGSAQTNLDEHIADETGAHAASAISYNGGTGLSATDVEAAIDELATEKLNTSIAVAAGDVFYATDANTIVRLAKGTAGQVLTMNAGATAPEWAEAQGGGSELDRHTASATSSGLSTGSTYASLDQMGDLEELTDMALTSGGGGYVTTIRLYCDTPSALASVRLWFYSGSVTLAADNAAYAISDADGLKVEGYFDLPIPLATTNGQFVVVENVNLDYTCDATSLFVSFQAITPTTANLGAVGALHLEVDAFRL